MGIIFEHSEDAGHEIDNRSIREAVIAKEYYKELP